MKRLYILLIILLSIFCINNVSAKDISEYVTISNLKLFDANNNEIEINKGDDPNNYTRGVIVNTRLSISFDYKIDLKDGYIEENDTATIPVSSTVDGFYADSEENLYDENGTIIGVIKRYSNKKFEIVLNSNAQNVSVISGSVFIKSHFIDMIYTKGNQVRMLRIGKSSVKYMHMKTSNTTACSIITPTGIGNVFFISNDTITYNASSGYDIERKLTDTNFIEDRKNPIWVENNLMRKNVYFEFELIDAIDINNLAFIIRVFAPLEDDSPTCGIYVQSINVSEVNILQPSSRETLDEFRSRIKSKELQAGIYKKGGKIYVMAYFGDIPNKNISNENANKYVENATSPYFTEQTKLDWLDAHSVNNVINGAPTNVYMSFVAKYNQVVTTTPKIANTILMYDDKVYNRVVTGNLQPMTISADIPVRNINLYTFDEDTNSVIPNSKFKLYRLNNDNWSEYGTIYTSDENGRIEITNLPNGKYKFEQVEYADNYLENSEIYRLSNIDNIINDDIHFEITSSDDEGYLLYVSNKKKEDSNTNNSNTNTTKDNSDVKGVSTDVVNPKTGVKSLIILLIPLSLLTLYIYNKQKRKV